ncbi:hypothetical protein ACFQY4_09280 [Catellatospora bangladeshensis]|uniref:hypothetical protein n=1 Tax=Catellatospora bangladeshensis TaxID=310355 RepID=UPI0036167572
MARRDTDEPDERRGRRSGIGDARAFTPRGRTTRDGLPPEHDGRPRARTGPAAEPDPQAEAELQRRRAELRMVRGGRAEEGRPPQRLGRVTGAPRQRPRRDEDDHEEDFAPEPPRAAPGRAPRAAGAPGWAARLSASVRGRPRVTRAAATGCRPPGAGRTSAAAPQLAPGGAAEDG